MSDLLSKMRRVWNPDTDEWLVPEWWIADGRTPDPLQPLEAPDASAAAHTVAHYIANLWLVRQAGQPIYLELRCESQDLMPRIARVALPYGVSVHSGSGMDGLKPKKEAAERAASRVVPTLIGHLSDYDRSGGDIADAFAEDAKAFARWHRKYQGAEGSLEVRRLGLTLEQATAHGLLDSNGKAELEGLPVPVLDAIIREFIESHLDPEIARAVFQAEPRMRAEAARLALRNVKKQDGGSSNQSNTGEDWSWARE